MTWATQSAVASMKDTTEDPNELLVLGYLEGQKIGVRLIPIEEFAILQTERQFANSIFLVS